MKRLIEQIEEKIRQMDILVSEDLSYEVIARAYREALEMVEEAYTKKVGMVESLMKKEKGKIEELVGCYSDMSESEKHTSELAIKYLELTQMVISGIKEL